MIAKEKLEDSIKNQRCPTIQRPKQEHFTIDIETIPLELEFKYDTGIADFNDKKRLDIVPEMSNYLNCFSSETIDLEKYGRMLKYFEEKKWDKKRPEMKTPKKSASPEEITEIEKKFQEELNEYTGMVTAQKACSAAFCKIVCLGIQTEEWTELITAYDDKTKMTNESEILKRFAAIYNVVYCTTQNSRLTVVTFNGLDFDIPTIEIRSAIDGINCPVLPKRRYAPFEHFDIRMILGGWSTFAMGNLDFWCDAFNVPLNKDLPKGDSVADLYLKGDIETIKAHCEDDLRKTTALYKKMVQ